MTVYDEDILNVLYVQGNGLNPLKISRFSTLLKISRVSTHPHIFLLYMLTKFA